jgi:hypothetical protein
MRQLHTIGVNLNSVTTYTSSRIFADVGNYFGGWRACARGYPDPGGWQPPPGLNYPAYDAQGYPIGLGDLESHNLGLTHSTLVGGPGDYPAGDYTFTFEGSGEIQIYMAPPAGAPPNKVLTFPSTGDVTTLVIPVLPTPWGIHVAITRSDPHNHVRAMRFLPPGETGVFTAAYLDGLKPFSIMRPMDSLRINSQLDGAGQPIPPITAWSQRAKPDWYTQTTIAGIAYEHLIALANTTFRSLWLNIPYKADDDYVRQCAQLHHDTLAPTVKLYLEWANEPWNQAGYAFHPTWQYVEDYRIANGCSWDQANARLMKVTFDIFRAVFADRPGQLQRVVASMVADPSHIDKIIAELVRLADPADANQGFEVASGAPYFGINQAPYNASTTTEQILNDMIASAKSVGPMCKKHADVVAKWETQLARPIPLIFYEGGQQIAVSTSSPWYNSWVATQTHDRAYRWTNAYLQTIGPYCDGIVWYNYIEHAAQWQWGVLQHPGEPADRTPKFNALADAASQWPTQDLVVVPPESTFVAQDTTTRGAYTGVYGGAARFTPPTSVTTPAITCVLTKGRGYTYSFPSTDPRCLDGQAKVWYDDHEIRLDIALLDGFTHKMDLYFVDWDSHNQRAGTVNVWSETAILATAPIARFESGIWLNFTVKGNVHVQVVHTGGVNIVISGVFFD